MKNECTTHYAFEHRRGSFREFYSRFSFYLVFSGMMLFCLANSLFAQGLKAEYYSNTQLGLAAATVRNDSEINFDWAQNAPTDGIGADKFSVRWSGKVKPAATGNYTFVTYSDDGVRLTVNKKLLINNWTLHGVSRNESEPMQLQANQEYDIRLEYYENYGDAVAKLLWIAPGQAEQIISADKLIPASGAPQMSAKEASRFLMQTTFGASPAEITLLQNIGYEAWIAEQFNSPTESYYAPIEPVTGNEMFQESLMGKEVGKHTIVGQDQLRQRVAYALSQIFVVSFRDGELQGNPKAISGHTDILQNAAFGTYRQLLEDMTLSQTMGLYLDMLKNDKGDPANGLKPNENYAREVLQLFSTGMVKLNADGSIKRDGSNNPIPTYGQLEVEGFAKVFTGWSYGGDFGTWYYPTDGRFQWNRPMNFYAEHHSTDSKLLLDGVTLPAGQTGQQDLEAALDNIANNESVAPFISRQLIQRLVTSNPSPGYISRIVAKFNDNGGGVRGDMKAVISAILLDTEARNPQTGTSSGHGKLREPLIRFLHLMRGTNAYSESGIYQVQGLESSEYGVGQLHFYSPSVFNFYPPDFAPQGLNAGGDGLVAPEFKIHTDGQMVNSTNQMIYLIYNGQREYGGDIIQMDYSLLQSKAGNAADLTDTIETIYVPGGFSQETREEMIALINETDVNDPTNRIRNAMYLLVMSPDFNVER
jgi:uncharacterized protein (DUF1800 family)